MKGCKSQSERYFANEDWRHRNFLFCPNFRYISNCLCRKCNCNFCTEMKRIVLISSFSTILPFGWHPKYKKSSQDKNQWSPHGVLTSYWRTRALTAYRVSQTESFWRHWVALWGKMKRSRAVSFSIFYFLVWQTHDPQLAISPAMALRTRWSPWPFISSLPYFLQQLLAQYLSYFKPWPLNNYCTLCIHCHID